MLSQGSHSDGLEMYAILEDVIEAERQVVASTRATELIISKGADINHSPRASNKNPPVRIEISDF